MSKTEKKEVEPTFQHDTNAEGLDGTHADSRFSLDDFREALAGDSLLGEVADAANRQDHIPLGRNEMDLPEPGMVDQPAEVPPTPDQETVSDTESVGDEYLSPDDMRSLKVKGKVYGDEVEYTVEDLLRIQQTQDAATKQLEDYKSLVKEYRDLVETQKGSGDGAETTPHYEDDLMTDEEKRMAKIQEELDLIKNAQLQSEQTKLQEQEDLYVERRLTEVGLSPDEAQAKIKAVVDANPTIAPLVQKLWSTPVTSQAQVEERQAMFEAVLGVAQTIDLPGVVRQAKEQGVAEGRTAAKVEAKRKLVSTPSGSAEAQPPSRADYVRQQVGRGEDGIAELLLETKLFKG
jgi:hypothetical protein